MTQLAFALNANECTGCKACVAACKDVCGIPVGFKLRRVVTGEAGSWQVDPASGILVPSDVFSYSISYACMHCAAPACLAKCPKGAISKDAETGIVAIDQELCIGCGTCARACPWDAPVVVPRIDGTRKTRKCDFCRDLLGQGEEPACVAACSMRCLTVVELEGSVPAGRRIDDEPLLAHAPELGPNMMLEPHRERIAHPGADVRVHSMPEEYQNG